MSKTSVRNEKVRHVISVLLWHWSWVFWLAGCIYIFYMAQFPSIHDYLQKQQPADYIFPIETAVFSIAIFSGIQLCIQPFFSPRNFAYSPLWRAFFSGGFLFVIGLGVVIVTLNQMPLYFGAVVELIWLQAFLIVILAIVLKIILFFADWYSRKKYKRLVTAQAAYRETYQQEFDFDRDE